MKLITGGAYQGKLAYAKERYGVQDGWIDGRTCGTEEILTCSGIHHFHEYVKRMLQDEQSTFGLKNDSLIGLEEQAQSFADRLCGENPEILIVSSELGYGVVPMEKQDRMWREAVGRICTCIAAKSEEVIRVVCGVGVRLKGGTEG